MCCVFLFHSFICAGPDAVHVGSGADPGRGTTEMGGMGKGQVIVPMAQHNAWRRLEGQSAQKYRDGFRELKFQAEQHRGQGQNFEKAYR